MRGLGLRPRADLFLRVHHLIELVVLVLAGPARLAFHAFVAGGDELARVLLPSVERLLLFIKRNLFVAHNVGRLGVILRRMLDLVLAHGLFSHQAARLTGAGAGFAISGTLGTVSSTIALMKIIGSQNNIGMARTPDLAVPCKTHRFV